jgi:hypothetical protein
MSGCGLLRHCFLCSEFPVTNKKNLHAPPAPKKLKHSKCQCCFFDPSQNQKMFLWNVCAIHRGKHNFPFFLKMIPAPAELCELILVYSYSYGIGTYVPGCGISDLEFRTRVCTPYDIVVVNNQEDAFKISNSLQSNAQTRAFASHLVFAATNNFSGIICSDDGFLSYVTLD